MSERTRKYLPVLKRINRLGDKVKRQFIRTADKDFVDCVSECAKNIIKGNVPLTPTQLKRLRREKNNVRALALKKTSLNKKKRILQKGGFLGALLPPVLGVLGSLLLANAGR
ncbi:MAG: hypothetical protein GY822_10830 [Deltaproteobacteria bacterium]|nr:hypothetical protein [Deltaproteobacteria bacterium]